MPVDGRRWMNRWHVTWKDVVFIVVVGGIIILAIITLWPQFAHLNGLGPQNLFIGMPGI
jgi:hypothetical protein